MKVLSFMIHLVVLNSGTAVTIDELEEKVHIVHAHQGRQAKILLELLGLDEIENEKVDIVEPVTYDEENIQDFDMINADINNKNKDEGKTRSLLEVFPFNNFTNSDHHEEHHHHDQDQEHPHDHDQHNHDEEDPQDHHIHHEEHDPDSALRNPLSNRTEDVFPFTLGVKSNDNVQDTSSFSISQLTQDINSVGVSDGKGKQCVDKVMFVEEIVYEEVQTCIHDYDRRCHISYVTTYQAQQVEECEENFRKECSVSFEVRAYNESIEVCYSPLVKDCSLPGPEVCRTEYETWCATRQLVHEVEEDVSECREEEEEQCKDVTEGYTTKTRCDKWPVTRCEVKKQTNTKHTPETKCIKEPREVCAPEGCTTKEGPLECHNEIKTVVVDQPIESCNLEPIKTCGHVTKLFPVLSPSEECSDVPKEICIMSRINPTKKKIPVIKKWCYVPSQASGLL